MPFRPSRMGAQKRKAYGRKIYRRPPRMLRSLRPIASRTHIMKRLARPALIQNSLGGPVLTDDGAGQFGQGGVFVGALPGTWETGLSAQFKLNSVIDPADITSLFDRYKIIGVKLKIHYLSTVGTTTGANNLPTLYYAFDGDDATTPVTAQAVLTKGYCKSKVLNANRPLSVYIKPRLTKEIFNSPVSTGYSSEKACWLDASYSQIPHYGLKFWLSDWVGGDENNNAIRIQPTYYLALKDTQ